MNPEDRLDDLLARGATDAPIGDPLAASLEAANEVRQLQSIPLPPALVGRLEAAVRARARALQQEEIATIPRLPTPRPRHGTPGALRPTRRLVVAGASALMACLLIGIILINASAHSLPGDWLYGIKQWQNQLTLAQAQTPEDRAKVTLQQLANALTDLRAEIADHHADANVQAALTIVTKATQTAQTAANGLPAGAARQQAQVNLAQALSAERATLTTLLKQVDWPMRLLFTKQLGALGAAVPQITAVTVTKETGNVLLRIQGSRFLPGITVLLDGQLLGLPSTFTSTLVSLQVHRVVWDGRDHLVGVQNPDGTAAEITVPNAGASNGNGGSNGNGNGNPTPVPGATPGNGHGHHGATPTPGSGHGKSGG